MDTTSSETVTGVDGWRRGWVAVTLHDGGFHSATVASSIRDLLSESADSSVIAIDIPIGLPEGTEPRDADLHAKRLLGRRSSCVFLAPPREVISAPTLSEAIRISRERFGKGISAQAFALKKRILEVDEVASDPRVIEVHPEISFRSMAGRPIGPKKSWNGQMLRRVLLEEQGIVLSSRLGDTGQVPVDDVLDAAAAAWSAHRFATGTALSLPPGHALGNPLERCVIWY